ncbi:hypothetical protein [Amycolatopsis sp. NPDC059657]|uniref:hypothetical protein n=1 Tax=Amycolatopsis sp. NPDC059657 TaxID=3346899 RepID=UPI0036712375
MAGSRKPEAVWGTFGVEPTILVIARTLTSTTRLLEALQLFRGDFRIKFLFTVNDTTPFRGGVHALLAKAGVEQLIPWELVPETHYDLALSASENVDFDHVTSHTIVLPHGLGLNKYVPTADGTGVRLAGLPPYRALADGRVTVVLSHPDQEKQVHAACPEAIGHTAVAGDATFDRLLASERLRTHYRNRFGAGDRTVVMVASTWRPDSALGRWRTLPAQLLAELPADRYLVCAALHPNIWSWYGPAQIRLWLADELAAGLVLLPPEKGWHAALIAADQVITDHGSLGLLAAGLDRPLLLTGESEETVPGTPVAELTSRAPHLIRGRALLGQLEQASAEHRPGSLSDITDRVFAEVGSATTRLRDLVYRELGMTPPDGEIPILRVPDPDVTAAPVTAFAVHADGEDPVTLTRYPAAVWINRPDYETHLAVDEAEPNLRITEKAAVLACSTPRSHDQAVSWTESALAAFPGARIAIAATPDGATAAIRGGRQVLVVTEAAGDALILGSVVYHCLMSGSLRNRRLTVLTGADSAEVELT